MIRLAEDVGPDVPSPTTSIATPNGEIKKAAKWMLKAKAVLEARTNDETKVQVMHILEVHVDTTAMETIRRLANNVVENEEDPFVLGLVLEKAEKSKTSRLYRDSVKWSTRRAHRVNMPQDGWLVDAENNKCGCAIHLKFGVCSHVVVARSVLGIGPG
ncbi:hypothetical protein GN958_ATG18353 [Phytophthora infestans]|uniref:SWIM-type domain-containing protein n=1 Tax=Phytophthora infestans TaxID=4787 RepID=A0A8S9TVN4_PHYIN|nr:hypothetical protein GN958_ATG18353 [Phytophthora infestans]